MRYNRLNAELVRVSLPPWLPFGQAGFAMTCAAGAIAAAGAPVVVVGGSACAIGMLSMGLFSGMYYDAVVKLAADNEDQQPVPQPAALTPVMDAPAGYSRYYTTAEVSALPRSLVNPAIPDWADVNKTRRVCLGIVARLPLTFRQWSPSVLTRREHDELWPWLRGQGLTEYIGNTTEVQATEAGRSWARMVIRRYPAVMARGGR